MRPLFDVTAAALETHWACFCLPLQAESGETVPALSHSVLVLRTSSSLRVAFSFPTGDPVWGRSDGNIQLQRETVVWYAAGSSQVRVSGTSTNQKNKAVRKLKYSLLVFCLRVTSQGSKVREHQRCKLQLLFDFFINALVLLCSFKAATQVYCGRRLSGSLRTSKLTVCFSYLSDDLKTLGGLSFWDYCRVTYRVLTDLLK